MELINLGEAPVDHLLRQVLPLHQEHVHLGVEGEQDSLNLYKAAIPQNGWIMVTRFALVLFCLEMVLRN